MVAKISKINVQGAEIVISQVNDHDYICLTDMVKGFGNDRANTVIQNWLRNKDTLEFLGIWERMNNSNFKCIEFDAFKMKSGSNRFTLSAKEWIEKTNAQGIISKTGRYGGTHAHKDIAYHFGMWLSPEFHLLVIKEFQRLKEEELKYLKSSEWLHRRFLTKAHYSLQTDTIKGYILPELNIPKAEEGIIYAQEAELLNVAVFGYTSKQWSENNPENVLKGENIRDNADNILLIALNSAQVLNRELIKSGVSQVEGLEIIRSATIDALKSLSGSPTIKRLEKDSKKTNLS